MGTKNIPINLLNNFIDETKNYSLKGNTKFENLIFDNSLLKTRPALYPDNAQFYTDAIVLNNTYTENVRNNFVYYDKFTFTYISLGCFTNAGQFGFIIHGNNGLVRAFKNIKLNLTRYGNYTDNGKIKVKMHKIISFDPNFRTYADLVYVNTPLALTLGPTVFESSVNVIDIPDISSINLDNKYNTTCTFVTDPIIFNPNTFYFLEIIPDVSTQITSTAGVGYYACYNNIQLLDNFNNKIAGIYAYNSANIVALETNVFSNFFTTNFAPSDIKTKLPVLEFQYVYDINTDIKPVLYNWEGTVMYYKDYDDVIISVIKYANNNVAIYDLKNNFLIKTYTNLSNIEDLKINTFKYSSEVYIHIENQNILRYSFYGNKFVYELKNPLVHLSISNAEQGQTYLDGWIGMEFVFKDDFITPIYLKKHQFRLKMAGGNWAICDVIINFSDLLNNITNSLDNIKKVGVYVSFGNPNAIGNISGAMDARKIDSPSILGFVGYGTINGGFDNAKLQWVTSNQSCKILLNDCLFYANPVMGTCVIPANSKLFIVEGFILPTFSSAEEYNDYYFGTVKNIILYNNILYITPGDNEENKSLIYFSVNDFLEFHLNKHLVCNPDENILDIIGVDNSLVVFTSKRIYRFVIKDVINYNYLTLILSENLVLKNNFIPIASQDNVIFVTNANEIMLLYKNTIKPLNIYLKEYIKNYTKCFAIYCLIDNIPHIAFVLNNTNNSSLLLLNINSLIFYTFSLPINYFTISAKNNNLQIVDKITNVIFNFDSTKSSDTIIRIEDNIYKLVYTDIKTVLETNFIDFTNPIMLNAIDLKGEGLNLNLVVSDESFNYVFTIDNLTNYNITHINLLDRLFKIKLEGGLLKLNNNVNLIIRPNIYTGGYKNA